MSSSYGGGLKSLPADQRHDHASGLIIAFVVDDLEGELARLQAEGVSITMPLTAEESGETRLSGTGPQRRHHPARRLERTYRALSTDTQSATRRPAMRRARLAACPG